MPARARQRYHQSWSARSLRGSSGWRRPPRLEVKRHPLIGAHMLERLRDDEIRDWIRWHHERVDGAGYPDALPGAEIPLGARILAVADASRR